MASEALHLLGESSSPDSVDLEATQSDLSQSLPEPQRDSDSDSAHGYHVRSSLQPSALPSSIHQRQDASTYSSTNSLRGDSTSFTQSPVQDAISKPNDDVDQNLGLSMPRLGSCMAHDSTCGETRVDSSVSRHSSFLRAPLPENASDAARSIVGAQQDIPKGESDAPIIQETSHNMHSEPTEETTRSHALFFQGSAPTSPAPASNDSGHDKQPASESSEERKAQEELNYSGQEDNDPGRGLEHVPDNPKDSDLLSNGQNTRRWACPYFLAFGYEMTQNKQFLACRPPGEIGSLPGFKNHLSRCHHKKRGIMLKTMARYFMNKDQASLFLIESTSFTSGYNDMKSPEKEMHELAYYRQIWRILFPTDPFQPDYPFYFKDGVIPKSLRLQSLMCRDFDTVWREEIAKAGISETAHLQSKDICKIMMSSFHSKVMRGMPSFSLRTIGDDSDDVPEPAQATIASSQNVSSSPRGGSLGGGEVQDSTPVPLAHESQPVQIVATTSASVSLPAAMSLSPENIIRGPMPPPSTHSPQLISLSAPISANDCAQPNLNQYSRPILPPPIPTQQNGQEPYTNALNAYHTSISFVPTWGSSSHNLQSQSHGLPPTRSHRNSAHVKPQARGCQHQVVPPHTPHQFQGKLQLPNLRPTPPRRAAIPTTPQAPISRYSSAYPPPYTAFSNPPLQRDSDNPRSQAPGPEHAPAGAG